MRVIHESTVYRNPYPNHRAELASASSLARVPGPSGDTLVCSFRTGAAKMSRDGRVRLARSDDRGRTWTPMPAPFDGLAPDSVAHAGTQLGADARGTLVLSAARMWIAEPEGEGWDAAAAGIVDADSMVVRGSLGAGWETPQLIDGRRHDDEWAIPCGPPLALGGGRWLWPMERHGRSRTPGWLRRYHAFVAISDDDGRTWPRQPPCLNGEDGRLAYYDQRMVRLPDGRVLSLAWVHDVDADTTLPAQAGTSDDGGETWSAPFDTGIVGGPVNPILLADGRLLAVYNRRTAPAGVRCALSEDGGRTWRLDEEWVLYDEASRSVVGERATDVARREADPALWGSMWGWTFGTPTPAQLTDGTVVVTFFATGWDAVTSIRAVRLEP